MNPEVSVVIPTYNRKNLLKETIEAVLAQTFGHFELIVVDNMSNDGTEEFVKEIRDPHVRYFRNPNHGIISVNRNFGIREAKTKYVAFCDDDDLWLPNKLQEQMRHFPASGISCVSTDFVPLGEPRFLRKAFRPDRNSPFRDFSCEEILLMNPVISSSVVARRDFLLELGGFDENPDFRCIEDWELWLRMSRKGKIRILTEPLVKYRISVKEGRDTRQITLNTLKVLEKQKSLAPLDESILRQARGNCFVSIGRAFLDCNDREGLLYFKRGFKESQGVYQKLRALAGIALFYLPVSLRNRLLQAIYSRMPCTS